MLSFVKRDVRRATSPNGEYSVETPPPRNVFRGRGYEGSRNAHRLRLVDHCAPLSDFQQIAVMVSHLPRREKRVPRSARELRQKSHRGRRPYDPWASEDMGRPTVLLARTGATVGAGRRFSRRKCRFVPTSSNCRHETTVWARRVSFCAYRLGLTAESRQGLHQGYPPKECDQK